MLEVRALTNATRAVRDVSFTIGRGEILGWFNRSREDHHADAAEVANSDAFSHARRIRHEAEETVLAPPCYKIVQGLESHPQPTGARANYGLSEADV